MTPRRATRRALRYAAAARHAKTALDRLTQCATVCRRLGWATLPDQPSYEDARGIYTRRMPPPRQVRCITFKELRRLTRNALPAVKHSLRLMFAAAARPSDWLGSEERRPVAARDVRVVGQVIHVLYRTTKPDIAGKGRRLAFTAPPSTIAWLVGRLRECRPHDQVLPVTYARLRAPLGRDYALRSLRRGACREILLASGSARTAMALTGHQDPKTVYRYAGVIAPEVMRRGLRASALALGVRQPLRPGAPPV